MGIWDDIGKGFIGAGTGYLTGGGLGGLAGGLTGGLLMKGKPLTLGTGLASGLLGGAAGGVTGALGKGIGGAWGRAKARTEGMPDEIDLVTGERSPRGGLWDTTKAFGQELWSGAKGLGGILAPGKLGGLSGGGGLGGLSGLLGGGGGGAVSGAAPGGVAPYQGYGGGGGGGGLGGLALLGGMGALGAGLMQEPENPDLEALLAGGQEQTRGMIAAQVAAEQARRQAAEEQYLASRGTAQKQLEDVLGAQSDFAMQQAIQGRQEQLNRQGLLGGPSGAMDFALAQEAARLRQSQLPQLLAFQTGTQAGLEGMRGAGLEGTLGLERAGVERQFGQTDQQTQARLLTQLLDAERKNRQRQALIEAGGAGIGYGLGESEGAAGVGGALGRLFGMA